MTICSCDPAHDLRHTSPQVAEGLQLRSRRRPPGFWDNEDALDRELGRFITGAWTQHRVDDDDNQTYFYNQVLLNDLCPTAILSCWPALQAALRSHPLEHSPAGLVQASAV